MTGKAYDVKDPALADQGRLRIDWACQEMPVRRSLMDRFRTERPLAGIRAESSGGSCLQGLPLASVHRQCGRMRKGCYAHRGAPLRER